MRIARTIAELHRLGVAGGVFVPTMGALHEGHASLMAIARRRAGTSLPVVASVFVNPTQFNEAADFDRYPRTFGADAAMCEQAGVDALFAPSAGEVYPEGMDVPKGDLPPVATQPGLEDARRPGHFAGVCQVVRRLFAIVEPAAAVFGEKDWQQLQVISAMVATEGLGVEIVPGPTVREPDGLAMSSRNRLLSRADRAAAGGMPRALAAAARLPDVEAAEAAMRRELALAGLEPEYAAVRDAQTLLSPRDTRPARALIAARAGSVRLIDNGPWEPSSPSHG
ncbi:MAG TPA: pantoate--beta-alanine ligase [Phycisphaerales bacterium]|nr:pantoate--beta-alanine ligase [Phycisphaerales bacterium]